MCESAELYPGVTANLIDVFADRGAAGVLGTEMPMATTFGDVFGPRFFELFISASAAEATRDADGATVGEVLLRLRREGMNGGNPFPFAYTYLVTLP